MLTTCLIVPMVADSYCRQQCMEHGKLKPPPQQSCERQLHQSRWCRCFMFHLLLFLFLFILRPYVKNFLSVIFLACLENLQVLFCISLALGFRCNHTKVQNSFVQESAKEIQRWISAMYCWLNCWFSSAIHENNLVLSSWVVGLQLLLLTFCMRRRVPNWGPVWFPSTICARELWLIIASIKWSQFAKLIPQN